MDFGFQRAVSSLGDFVVGLGSSSTTVTDVIQHENKSGNGDSSPTPQKIFNIAVHATTSPISPPTATAVDDHVTSPADDKALLPPDLRVISSSLMPGMAKPIVNDPVPPSTTTAELDVAADDDIHKTWKWTEKYGHIYAVLIGLIIVLYGHFFPRTLLVFQAIGVSGGPKLRQAFHDLYHHYVRAKKAFMDELPRPLEKGEDPLKELTAEMASVVQKIADQNTALKGGKIPQGQCDSIVAELTKTMEDLKAKQSQLRGMSSSLGRIAASINPQDIEEVCLSVYLCLAGAVAAVSSTVLARVAMALKIGQAMSERVLNVVWVDEQTLVEGSIAKAQRDWLKAGVDTVATAIGLYASCYIEEKMVVFSMCAMGSKLVMDAFEALLREYIMIPLKLLETNERRVIEKVCFQVLGIAVTGMGVWAHIDPRVAHLFGLGGTESLVRVVLIPFFYVESFLTNDLLKG